MFVKPSKKSDGFTNIDKVILTFKNIDPMNH